MLGNNLTEIVKEMLATSSMKNLNNLEIPSSYYQIDESDNASVKIIGIIGS